MRLTNFSDQERLLLPVHWLQLTLRLQNKLLKRSFLLSTQSTTSCTDDEDFYYTEVELDSPFDSSGVSSAGQSPMYEPSNNSLSTTNASMITNFNEKSPPITIKQAARKRGPRNKELIIESKNHKFDYQRFNLAEVATWMHKDMAKPATEDPEYKARLNANNDSSNSTTVKRERKRAASNQYVSDHSDYEASQQMQQAGNSYLNNMTAEQLTKLQHQNKLHLKNNIQHLQQLQRHHQQMNQLHQLQQYQQVKRKYTKHSQQSGSILIPGARTKSVICSMAQLENEFEQHLLNNPANSLGPNQLKRSKPIKIPGISLAHRDYSQQPNQSSSFPVGSVQLSPNGYFHCFSPTPPHSLSSPTSSSSSMYSLGSCNSPGSSSIASSASSYSPNGQSPSVNRNSAHYSPIDTLLQTVENERLQQRLAMEDESASSTNSSRKAGTRKLKSANVSDLDLVAQNDEEEESSLEQQQQPQATNLKPNNSNENNELENSRLETIKCTTNQIINLNNNSVKKTIVVRNGQTEASAEENQDLTVDCSADHSNRNASGNDRIDLQTKQLVQTAQQALVTLASTASNASPINQKSNSIIQTNSTNSQIVNRSVDHHRNNENDNLINQIMANNQNNGLLMAANAIIQSAAASEQQASIEERTHGSLSNSSQTFNYLVSQSGRTIKPTAAAKSYVQRKNRIKAYMRTQNLASSLNTGKQQATGKAKSDYSNLLQFERLLEAAQSNSNQNDNGASAADLNMVRNSIISSVGSLSNHHRFSSNAAAGAQQSQLSGGHMPVVQRTPTGRIRNSGAKCRKKFGMENRSLWCIQCRWKKVSFHFLLNFVKINSN